MNDSRTYGQRWADRVTEFSSSWAFIGWFAMMCIGWIAINAAGSSQWDPYPFLFLNWILTVVSTFQSPLILLSQNRQNDTDRERVNDVIRRLESLQASIDSLRPALLRARLLDIFRRAERDGLPRDARIAAETWCVETLTIDFNQLFKEGA